MIELFKAVNMSTSISNHLTQCFIIGDQTTNFEENGKKEILKIRKFNKDNL